MAEAFSIMLWPLIACLLLPGILVYYGLHIVRREIIFVDQLPKSAVGKILRHEAREMYTEMAGEKK